MIKLIASDLDGTLLTTNKELTPRLKKSLDKAAQNGALFVPATGRTLCAIPQYVKDIPSAKYIITSNGACVYKKALIRLYLKNVLCQNMWKLYTAPLLNWIPL